MKYLVPLVACYLMLASPLSAQNTTVLGLPSAMAESTREAAYNAVVKIAAAAKTGDKLQVYDAKSGDRVCSMTFPTGNIRIRMRKLVAEFRALQGFLKRSTSTRAADREQVRVPQFLSTVGASLRQGSGKTQVVIYGRPAYADPRDPVFTWGDGVVPNDAYITAPSSRSVFGTADRSGKLNEVVVHFCYVTDRFKNELERRAAIRFWALYMKELGATLSTFELSPDVVLERVSARSSDPLLPQAELDRKVKEFVMVRYTNTEAEKGKDTRQPSTATQPAARRTPEPKVTTARKALETAAEKIARPAAGGLTFGAIWLDATASHVDVDLYVRAHPKAEELYFSHRKTTEGRHLGDVTTSQVLGSDANWKTTAEVIELLEGSLGDVEVWVNLFSNRNGGRVEGLVRVLDPAGRSFDVPFSFEGQGDTASGRSKRTGLPTWKRINLTPVLSQLEHAR